MIPLSLSPKSQIRGWSVTRRTGAFTLVEVMIAMAMLTIILSAVYSSWWAVVRSSKIGMETAIEVQRSRMAIRSLVDSLLCVQMYGGNATLYAFESEAKNDYSYLSFVARLPASFPSSGLFGDNVMRRVTFDVEAGDDGNNHLVMSQMPLLQQENVDQKPYTVTLSKNVNTFILEFWDAKANDWTTEWLQTNQLPKFVRVTLGTGGLSGRTADPGELITRVIALPAMVIPREYQIAAPGGPNRQNTGSTNRFGNQGPRGNVPGFGRQDGGIRRYGGGQ